MKKSTVIFLLIILLGILTACSSDNTASEALPDKDKVATIVAGTLSAIPTNTSLPTETLTPETSPTPITQCKGNLTGIVLTMPNHLWSCSVDILPAGGGEMEVVRISSQVFKIEIGYRVGRGLWCEPNQDENCVVSPFYENKMVKLSLYKWHGENKEIYGHVQRREGSVIISIKYLNMEKRELNKTEMDELVHFIDSVTFEHE